jgi:3-oxoacyl-[acyl-carrier protein] reductase
VSRQVIAVTGGGRGIGLAITTRLLAAGYGVVANTHRTQALPGELLDSYPDRIVTVSGDIGVERTSQDIVEAAQRLGRLHAVVHSAGVCRDRLLMTMDKADWDEVIRVNLGGAFLITKHALKVMTRQRYGRLVYVSSAAALMGNAGQSSYAASKAGIEGLSRSVSQEYARFGVRTVALSPGLVDGGLGAQLPPAVRNERRERQLLGEAAVRHVAGTVAFLVGPDADHINGTVVHMHGGIRF